MAATNITIKDYIKDLPGEVPKDDPITYVFPLIKSKNRSDKETNWRIIVRIMENVDSSFIPITDDYFINKQLPVGVSGWIKVLSNIDGGDMRSSVPDVIKSGKNIGKTNETNVFTQALREAYGKYKKQLQKSMDGTGHGEDNRAIYPPMLAQKLSDNKLDFSKDIYVQRKFNGVRALTTIIGNRLMVYSRTRHEYFVFDHIKHELEVILKFYNDEHKGKHLVLDGEMYNHGMDLQEISGLARKLLISDGDKGKEEGDKIKKLKYYIYDCFIVENNVIAPLNFSERLAIYTDLLKRFPGKDIVSVETFKVSNMEEINKYYAQFLAEKYEGSIVRLNCGYEPSYNDYHSKCLLKMKPRLDEEFVIVDYIEAVKGKSKGVLMFILETANGKRFNIKPGGITDDELKQLYKKMSEKEHNNKTVFENKYKGKKLTVLFDEYSKDKIPSRATTNGIVIRDYE